MDGGEPPPNPAIDPGQNHASKRRAPKRRIWGDPLISRGPSAFPPQKEKVLQTVELLLQLRVVIFGSFSLTSATRSQSLSLPLRERGLETKEQGGPAVWTVSHSASTHPSWPRPAAPITAPWAVHMGDPGIRSKDQPPRRVPPGLPLWVSQRGVCTLSDGSRRGRLWVKPSPGGGGSFPCTDALGCPAGPPAR